MEHGLLKAFQKICKSKADGFTLEDLTRTLQGMASESKDETLQGLFFDLNSLSMSEWGAVLGCSTGDYEVPQSEVTLFDVTRKNEILFVDLPTEAKKTQSQRVGRLLLQEIMLLSGIRKNYPHLRGTRPFSIYVDEFDAFATPAFSTFLNKGRSSGFMIHLAHQTLSDLKLVSEEFAGQIMGNTNVRFIFRQDDPDDAETWARFFGTKATVKRTFQTQDGAATGMSSNREVQEFRVSPDRIKELMTGRCIVSIKTARLLQEIAVPLNWSTGANLQSLPLERGPVKAKEEGKSFAQLKHSPTPGLHRTAILDRANFETE